MGNAARKRPSGEPVATRRQGSRRLSLEPLEERLPLAGNVVATVVNGHLTLIGDIQANQVFVGDLGGGRFAIRGLTGDTGSATTINGQSELIVEIVTGDVNVEMGAGTDLFYLANDSDWNNGDPFAETWPSGGFAPLASRHGFADVQGKLTVNLGIGDDTGVIASSAGGGMVLRGGIDAGDDGLFLRTNPERPTGSVDVDLGLGNDYAALSLSSLGESWVRTGEGNDTLLLAFYGSSDVTVDLGAGSDRLVFQGGSDSWNRWNGNPELPPATNQVSINGREGNDDLLVGELRARSLIVDAGAGVDKLLVRGVTTSGDAWIRGGSDAGSSIVVQDYSKPMPSQIDDPYFSAYPQVVVPVPTHIGGDLIVSFNAPRLFSAHDGLYTVTVGGSYDYYGSDFDVAGQLRMFGTVGNDDIFIRRMSAAGIAIDTGWGNDFLQVGGIDVAGDVSVLLGDGDDRGLYLEDHAEVSGHFIDGSIAGYNYTPTHIGGDLSIDLGAGFEAAEIFNTLVLPRVLFSVGARNSGLVDNFVVVGSLNVNTGPGYADFQVLAARLDSAEIRTGNDGSLLRMNVFVVAHDLTVYGGIGFDQWQLNGFGVGGDLTLHSGDNGDSLRINTALSLASSVQGQMVVYAGGGDDAVEIGGDHMLSSIPVGVGMFVRRTLLLDTGAGNDRVTLWKVQALDLLMAQMGSGNDHLAVMHAKALRARFDGGNGSDLISPLEPSDYGNVSAVNFEGQLYFE